MVTVNSLSLQEFIYNNTTREWRRCTMVKTVSHMVDQGTSYGFSRLDINDSLLQSQE